MDYKEILELTENSAEEVRKTKKGAPKKSDRFIIQYSDGFDMVIDNKEGDRLIFSPSKKEYMFKKQDGTVLDLTSASTSSWIIGRFAGKSKLKINNHLIDTLDRNVIYMLIDTAKNDDARKLLEKGMFSLKSTACDDFITTSQRSGPTDYDQAIGFIKNAGPEYLWLCDNTSFLTSSKWNFQVLLFMINLKELYGTDISRYFAKTYNKSSIEIENVWSSRYIPVSSLRALFKLVEPKRFIDYMCYELYTQGIRTVNIAQLVDYMFNIKEFNEKYGSSRSYFSEHYESDSKLSYSGSRSYSKEIEFSYEHYIVIFASWSPLFEDYMYKNHIYTQYREKLIFKDKAGNIIAYSLGAGGRFHFIKTLNGEAPDNEMKAIIKDVNQKGLR